MYDFSREAPAIIPPPVTQIQSQKPPSPIPMVKQQQQQQQTQQQQHKSQTVAEIEKLKKGREERRAKIEQQRHEMAATVAAVEPGHANWEFARMIQEFRSKVEMSRVWAADAVRFFLGT